MSFRLVTEGSILLLVLTSLLAIQGCGSGDSTEEEAQELSESMSEADTSPPPLRAITTSAPTADAPLPDVVDGETGSQAEQRNFESTVFFFQHWITPGFPKLLLQSLL